MLLFKFEYETLNIKVDILSSDELFYQQWGSKKLKIGFQKKKKRGLESQNFGFTSFSLSQWLKTELIFGYLVGFVAFSVSLP